MVCLILCSHAHAIAWIHISVICHQKNRLKKQYNSNSCDEEDYKLVNKLELPSKSTDLLHLLRCTKYNLTSKQKHFFFIMKLHRVALRMKLHTQPPDELKKHTTEDVSARRGRGELQGAAIRKVHEWTTKTKMLLFDLLWLHAKLVLKTIKEGISVSLLYIHLIHITGTPRYKQ